MTIKFGRRSKETEKKIMDQIKTTLTIENNLYVPQRYIKCEL